MTKNMASGYVYVGQIFEFVESIGAMLRSFSRLALPANGYLQGSYYLAR
jgi:hypothetical protein